MSDLFGADDRSEAEIQAGAILAVGSRKDVRVFRNHVGFGWSGKFKRKLPNGDVILTNARPATFGLQPGSADLIGWRIITITPEMVGRRIAQFLSIEVKDAKGRPSAAQRVWQSVVSAAGGLAGLVRSPAEAVSLVECMA
jgi:hypothetical protein